MNILELLTHNFFMDAETILSIIKAEEKDADCLVIIPADEKEHLAFVDLLAPYSSDDDGEKAEYFNNNVWLCMPDQPIMFCGSKYMLHKSSENLPFYRPENVKYIYLD